MSGSTERSTYDPLPVSASKTPHVPERQQSPSFIEEKSEHPREESPKLIRHWRWEIFTFLLGTGAFVSILALLLKFRNKPPESINLGYGNFIQLTAIIAALAQVAQSALLVPISYCIGQLKWKWFQSSKKTVDLDRFDMASRGPDGSIRLLFHLSWRQRLVSLGALATVLMLLFPTFVQQSVQVGEREVVSYNSGDAKLARSINVFAGPDDKLTLFTLTDNGTVSSYETYTSFSAAIMSGATSYGTPSLVYSSLDSDTSGRCQGIYNPECSWPPFNNLGLCVSTSNISDQIMQNGDQVYLPALQDFITKGEDTPTFQSGIRVYVAEGESASISKPTTSASDGTNLPSLAEIYYFYYDVCIDRGSEFNLSNPRRWTALKGQLQFCVQKLETETYQDGGSITNRLEQKTHLDWYKTTKSSQSAWCTKVESEKEDFCVAEMVMESISHQMTSIFNATAFFSDENRTDIKYSSAWVPRLTRAVFGGESDTTPACPVQEWQQNAGGQNPNPFVITGESGLYTTLNGMAQRLSDAFRSDERQSQEVLGTYRYHEPLLLVDFRWFILPAVLYAIVTVFFAATIVTTRNTPMWKSSPLPLLHATKEEGVGTEDKVRKEAKKSRLRLTRVAAGWQLVNGEGARKRSDQ